MALLGRAVPALPGHRLPWRRHECPNLGAGQRRHGPTAGGYRSRRAVNHGTRLDARQSQEQSSLAPGMIELQEVTKKYGTKIAVDCLSLHIKAGELFAFLGPNGAGKTTTIKLMCRLLFPTAGSVRVGGFDLGSTGDQARQLISYVPDQPYLYEKLTGREFLQFIADMYGLSKELGRQRLEAMIELFDLSDF